MPQYTLLATKFYVPPARPELVSRSGLLERLNFGVRRKLTLISAPAGFGKTTLASEWIRSMASNAGPRPTSDTDACSCIWLSLDEGDNDPARFLTYVITAISRIPGRDVVLGADALTMLQSPQPPPAKIILTSLINEVATISDRIVCVLDDYHLIEAQPVHESLAFLVEHLPPQMHLAITTRVDPPLPLSRLRARGQLTELRATDLRFTSSEAAEFLSQVMGLDLSAEDVAALEVQTEGWIAGLQLAALSLQGREETTSLINSFTGSHRFVLDYLIDEVLDRQTAVVQAFLLQTAVLDRLTGSLCDALTGQDNGQATLEMLEHRNLFIVPLDEERHWYRYHHLFADLLRQRLRRTQPDRMAALHHQASAWCDQHGYADGAIEHALRGEDFGEALRLIGDQADDLWQRSEHLKLRHWFSRLPEDLLLSRPQLCIFQAWFLFSAGQSDAAEQCLQAAQQVLDASADNVVELRPPGASPADASPERGRVSPGHINLRGRLAAIRALMGSWGGDPDEIIHYARQALESLPKLDPWRGPAALALGDAYQLRSDLASAAQAQLEAAEVSRAAGDIVFLMLANLKLAITLRLQGRLQRTAEICRQQMQLADEHGLAQSVIAGWCLAIWGEVLAVLNDLDGALERATEGVARTLGGDLALRSHSNLCLLQVLVSRGDLAGAREVVHELESLAQQYDLPSHTLGEMAAWRVRLWLAQGKLDSVLAWAQERGLDADGGPAPSSDAEAVLLARALLALGRPEGTARLLQAPLQAAEAGGRTSTVIEILVLQAPAYRAEGDMEQAIATLARALTLAEPLGFIRTFVDEGLPMAQLLYEAARRGMSPDYARRLLSAFPVPEAEQRSPVPAPAQPADGELIEPLSERELEVLQLIAEGFTNPEIAAKLYLSLNTVKAHTRNIYGKLGVHNRIHAVARARDAGVLPSI